jgi:hypothetical protein
VRDFARSGPAYEPNLTSSSQLAWLTAFELHSNAAAGYIYDASSNRTLAQTKEVDLHRIVARG